MGRLSTTECTYLRTHQIAIIIYPYHSQCVFNLSGSTLVFKPLDGSRFHLQKQNRTNVCAKITRFV